VREDAHIFYAFARKRAQALPRLIKVSGVGSKIALALVRISVGPSHVAAESGYAALTVSGHRRRRPERLVVE